METSKKSAVGCALLALASLLTVAPFQGCSTASHATIPRASAGKVQHLDSGTVVAVRPVTIDGEKTYLGISSGAIVGSAVGQSIGAGNDGRVLAGAVGAVAGAVIGSEVEKKLTEKVAQEVTISLDDGRTVVVVQEFEQPGFIAGDRVNVMETRVGDARVALADNVTDGLYQAPPAY